MSYKSRSNWLVGICIKRCLNRDIKCSECVGGREYLPAEPIRIDSEARASHKMIAPDFKDNPKQMAYIKLGREINKFKERDNCYDPKIIDKRFGAEANEIGKPKENKELTKAMTRDYIEGLKRAYKKV